LEAPPVASAVVGMEQGKRPAVAHAAATQEEEPPSSRTAADAPRGESGT